MQDATTVAIMLFVLIGVVVGALVALGRIPALADVAVALTDGVTSIGNDALAALIRRADLAAGGTAAVVIQTVGIALMPGIVAGVLMGAARSGVVLRRVGALFAAAAGVWTILTQPAPVGIVAGVLLIVLGALFAFLVGSALSFSAAAVSSTIAVTQIRLFLDTSSDSRFLGAATDLAAVAAVGDVRLWSLLLAVASVALPVSILFAAVRD